MLQCVNILIFFTAALLGCGDDDGPSPDTDAGPPPDSGPEGCSIPDTECPEEQPYSGGACNTTDSCMYDALIPMGGMAYVWTYTCVDSEWSGTSNCKPAPGGSCPVGPLAETCRSPSTATVTGATVELGPAGASTFRPFMPMETAELIYGGQGAPMISYRFRITGEGIPRCVSTTTTITMDGVVQPVLEQPALLHCGETLTIQRIVPDNCDPTAVPLVITIDVEGIGTGTATLSVTPACRDGMPMP